MMESGVMHEGIVQYTRLHYSIGQCTEWDEAVSNLVETIAYRFMVLNISPSLVKRGYSTLFPFTSSPHFLVLSKVEK